MKHPLSIYLLLSVACISTTPKLFSDLVPNSDFTEMRGGSLSSWKIGNTKSENKITDESGQPGPQGVSISLEKIKEQSALKLESDLSGEAYGLAVSAPFPLLPGYDYEMSIEYQAKGLHTQSVDRNMYASLVLDLFMSQNGKFLKAQRIQTSNNSQSWITANRLATFKYNFQVPESANQGVARIALTNKIADAPATAWVRKVSIRPLDPRLSNSSFENLTEENQPECWQPYGSARTSVDMNVARSGSNSAKVSDAPDGPFTGWSITIPVRSDREYSLSGYIKTGTINANGFLPGGALEIQFLDRHNQPLGNSIRSDSVESNQDWTAVKTPMAQAPQEAVSARLTAGMLYTRGTAWFDDLSLAINEVAAEEQVIIDLQHPGPDPSIHYAENLLPNGDIELGENGKPSNWIYVGNSKEDWTEEELEKLYANGRPDFSIGRGKGVWSQDLTYAGKGALLNVSIDPPLSPRNSWYGRNPVDGYWLSDPAECKPGADYVCGAWIRPGKTITRAWTGPLEILFYDKNGKALPRNTSPRSGIHTIPAGNWSYYATLPYTAPDQAHFFRVRFGQELAADRGGWGRTYADNIAVWKISPEAANEAKESQIIGNTNKYRDWFASTHKEIAPPFLPSPNKSVAYENLWGKLLNSTPGNIYRDPTMDIDAKFSLHNLLGEQREIGLRVTIYDSWGEEWPAIEKRGIHVAGSSTTEVHVNIPAPGAFGSFYAQAELLDGDVVIGKTHGRFGLIPEFVKPEIPVPTLGTTQLIPILGNGNAYEQELGSMLQIGGFGLTWVRLYYAPTEEDLKKRIAEVLPEIDWYRSIGLECVVQLIPKVHEPVDPEIYKTAGRTIAEALKGKVLAYGNWGIEQANSNPFYRDGWGDLEYDTILASQYDGIKSIDPEQLVLTGNIATDLEAKTIKRLYQSPANGKFDGTIINAYSGMLKVMQNALTEFDKHGDSNKAVWSEEQATQRSPFEGEARRYGEIDGAKTLVRNWLTLIAKLHPRIRSVNIWGFVRGTEAEIMMVTPSLQPRPQFVAHAVLADFLRSGEPSNNYSTEAISLYEWTYEDATSALVAWSNAGEKSITLSTKNKEVMVTDIMGNSTSHKTHQGEITLKLTDSPIFITNGGHMEPSQRLTAVLQRNDTVLGQPSVRLKLSNNMDYVFDGTVTWKGDLVDTKSNEIKIEPHGQYQIQKRVITNLPQGKTSVIQAEIRTPDGTYYAQSGAFNFGQAVHVSQPPAMDGTWKDWASAQVIPFGVNENEIVVYPKRLPDVTYRGKDDIVGNLRLLWDEHYLYLGVEALDDRHVAQPERNQSGFMGDSIEFGFQPDDIRKADAPYWEFEAYLPENDTKEPMLNRRHPTPAIADISWIANIEPTGNNGDMTYQIAIPWNDIGIDDAKTGKTFSMAVVLNDADRADRLSGSRKRIRWFSGIDVEKDPTNFGQIQLVQPN